MEKRWKCPKCGNTEFFEKEVAMTGTGLSKIFDIQHNEYIVITCKRCGYSEFYDKSIVKSKNELMDILDIFFG